jgi:UDP-N-acetyl-2-amino-2-deoxyglucuronate dehydrogenase
MRIGLVGTGAIAWKHAQAYRNIGFTLAVCTNRNAETGRRFAAQTGARFVDTFEEVCSDLSVDLVDVCTFPEFRLPVVEACARRGKHVQVQKPIATDLATARKMIGTARSGGVRLGVVSQHRFDDASLFLSDAIRAGRLGRLLQCDCYVKWYRSADYYSKPIKGMWKTEGGGALINQAIHQVDLMRWFAGPITQVFAYWQLGAIHKIESEDIVTCVVRYANGATGVIQASTAFWPGYPERIELHGSKGSAIISGDQLIRWDVADDSGPPPPLRDAVQSGASDPMAISLLPFERQFLDLAAAIREGRDPLVSGEEGYRTLAVVDAVYRSCRSKEPILLDVS